MLSDLGEERVWDDRAFHVTNDGSVLAIDDSAPLFVETGARPRRQTLATPDAVDGFNLPIHHSNPSSTKTLFLNFQGEVGRIDSIRTHTPQCILHLVLYVGSTQCARTPPSASCLYAAVSGYGCAVAVPVRCVLIVSVVDRSVPCNTQPSLTEHLGDCLEHRPANTNHRPTVLFRRQCRGPDDPDQHPPRPCD